MDYVYFEKLLSENKDFFEKNHYEQEYNFLATRIKESQEKNTSIGRGAKNNVKRLANCYILLEKIIKRHKGEPIQSVSNKLQSMLYEDLKIAAKRRKNNKDIVNRLYKNGYKKVPMYIDGKENYLYTNSSCAIWSPVDYGNVFTDPTQHDISKPWEVLFVACGKRPRYMNASDIFSCQFPLNKEETKMEIFIRSKTTLYNENYCIFTIPGPQKPKHCWLTIKVEAKTIMDCIDFTNCDRAKLISKSPLFRVLEDPDNIPDLILLFEGKKEHSAYSLDCEMIEINLINHSI